MKKILALSILVSAAFALHSQSLIGSQLKSKEAIVLYLIEQEKLAHDLHNACEKLLA